MAFQAYLDRNLMYAYLEQGIQLPRNAKEIEVLRFKTLILSDKQTSSEQTKITGGFCT